MRQCKQDMRLPCRGKAAAHNLAKTLLCSSDGPVTFYSGAGRFSQEVLRVEID
jgi:hypothetical protein